MSSADRIVLRAAKARLDDRARAEEALQRGGNPNCRDEYHITAFMWCARKGHVATARVLVAAGADVNARDNCQRTALHHAVLFGRLLFIEYLLGIGADLAVTDMHECTALDLALYQDGLPRIDRRIIPTLKEAGAPTCKH